MPATVKAYKGMGMEGSVARWYDRTTRKGLPEIKSLAARIAAVVPSGPAAGTVLEIALDRDFSPSSWPSAGLRVRAVDISKTFVEIAQRNAAADGVEVRFELGNAAALSLDDASVDFVVLPCGIQELRRARKSAGGDAPRAAAWRRRAADRPAARCVGARVAALCAGLGRKLAEPLVYDVHLSHHVDQAGLSAGRNSPHGHRSGLDRAAR